MVNRNTIVLATALLVLGGSLLTSNKLLSPTPKAITENVSVFVETKNEATVAGEIATQTQPVNLLIDCIGPDGKLARASQKDCDNLNLFWKSQQQQSIAQAQGESNIVSSSQGSNSSPTPTPTPTVGTTSATFEFPTPTPNPTSTPVPSTTITVSTTSVVVSLSKANAEYGLIYGSGFTITSQGAEGFEIVYTGPTSGQGFYESSGGMAVGSSRDIRSYINANKSNGLYTGSAVVKYYKDGSWQPGPTVSYSITLTD